MQKMTDKILTNIIDFCDNNFASKCSSKSLRNSLRQRALIEFKNFFGVCVTYKTLYVAFKGVL